MKINWKVRLKNKNFWLTLIPAILLFMQRKWQIRRARQNDTQDDKTPCDLVSVINSIKQKGIGYKIFRILWWMCTVAFSVTLVFTTIVGFMAGDLFSDITVLIIGGGGVTEVAEYLIDTPLRNFRIWTEFIGDISKSDATFAHFLKFSNYLVSVMFLPMLVTSFFYIAGYLPISIGEKLFIGSVVRKKKYNTSDTLAVFERPILIYNSKDSFDKAYTYFPFIERLKGRFGAVAADLLYYGANIFCCLFGLFVLGGQTVIKVIARVLFEYMCLSSNAFEIFIAVAAVLLYVIAVIVVRIGVRHIIRAIQKKQLKRWQITPTP